MTRPTTTIRMTAVCGCAAAALGCGEFASADVRITGDACAGTARVVARDARLSAVLGDLARAFRFELGFKSERDPLVSFDMTGTPADLVAAIARGQNTSLAHAPDARCANGKRLAGVWLLPETPVVTAPAHVMQPPPRTRLVESARTYDGNYLLLTAPPVLEHRR